MKIVYVGSLRKRIGVTVGVGNPPGIPRLVLSITGNTEDPATPTEGTIVFSAREDLDVVATGDAVIVSTTMADDAAFRRHTVVTSCVNGGSGSIVVTGADRIVSLGNHRGAALPNVDFYTGDNASAPVLTWNMNEIPANVVKIRQGASYAIILPATGNKALPTGLTYLFFNGVNINWTYTGSLPTGLTYLFFSGVNINWTGTTIGNTGTPKPNMTAVIMNNYRINAMDYPDLFLILDSFRDNVGNMPATVSIREQIAANVTAIAAATENETGTDPEKAKFKIITLKSTKGITSFSLNTTGI